jgi:hypothetical protein
VDYTFLRSRDSRGAYGGGLCVGDTPQIRYRNAVTYLGLISDVKLRDEYLKKLVFTADGHPDLIGDTVSDSGRGGGARGQLVEVLQMSQQELRQIIRGAAVMAQQKSYWDLAYQLYNHVQANEDAENILESQLRRLLMQHSGERAHWMEYARARVRADVTQSRAGLPASRSGVSGAASDRHRRLRLLVYIGDFFTAYHDKKPARALQVLDEAGVLQNTVERIQVVCPPEKRPGGTVQCADRAPPPPPPCCSDLDRRPAVDNQLVLIVSTVN